ncbi:MAG: hypothetical protein JXO72_04665 [Vicinamibacteria bacterium]|nr:hypothetical protein [Vicinamibacteria bacterium]
MRKTPLRFLGLVVAAVAVHLGMFYLSAPEGPILGFPVHHDDFRNLSYRSFKDLPSLTVRPVSTLVLGVLSIAGRRAYYSTLHLLIALYVSLVLWFTLRVFPSGVGWASLLGVVALFGAMMFEYEPEYALYSGLITNLVSAVMAVGALLLLDVEPRRMTVRCVCLVSGVAMFAGSLLAKEDFALAVVLMLALRALERGRRAERGPVARRVALGSLVVVVVLVLAWSFTGGRTSFLRSPSPFYQPDFSPSSLVRTTIAYMTCSPGACFATGLQLGVLVVVSLSRNSTACVRSMGLLAVTLALVVPYAALPRHFFPYYAFNWIVWQASSLLALGPVVMGLQRQRRAWLVAAIVLTPALWAATTQARRSSLIRWYKNEANRNRQIVRTLAELGATLRPWRTVGVVGVMPLNPWFGNDGFYLRNRLGFLNDWTVFADSRYIERTLTLLGALRLGAVEVEALENLPATQLPVIVLSPDGNARLMMPELATLERLDFKAATLVARPERVRVCDGTGLGITTLEWRSPRPVEVRVDSPEGPVFAALALSGRADTGKWVRDGTSFFLRERNGRVAAALVMQVTTDGCH